MFLHILQTFLKSSNFFIAYFLTKYFFQSNEYAFKKINDVRNNYFLQTLQSFLMSSNYFIAYAHLL